MPAINESSELVRERLLGKDGVIRKWLRAGAHGWRLDVADELSGKEAAIFLPTGTQANLVALLSHCERGEEYIVGQAAHNYLFEAGGAAVLGSIQPQPIDAAADRKSVV